MKRILTATTAAFSSGILLGFLAFAGVSDDDDGAVQNPPPGVIEPMPGSSVAGCQLTEQKCSNPYTIRTGVGKPVTFSNTDNTAHTITSGTTKTGPDGAFDSGLVLSGSTYEIVITQRGEYDWFCLVHPWRTGMIIVW